MNFQNKATIQVSNRQDKSIRNVGQNQNNNVQRYSKHENTSHNGNLHSANSGSLFKRRTDNCQQLKKNYEEKLSKSFDRNARCNPNVNIQIISINNNIIHNKNICNVNIGSLLKEKVVPCRNIDQNNEAKISKIINGNIGRYQNGNVQNYSNIKSGSNSKNNKVDSDSQLRGQAAQLRQLNKNNGGQLKKEEVHVLNKIIHNPNIGSNKQFEKDLSKIEKKFKK